MGVLRRAGVGTVAALVFSMAGLVVTIDPAEARKVGNPGSGFSLRVQNGFMRIRTNSFDFVDEGRQPQCSDGSNNDSGQDSAVDFPADPQCTSATDDSETQSGFQPKQPIQMNNGTITAAGAVTFPAANVSFPPQYLYVDADPLDPFVVTINVIPTHDVTGSINPLNGALSLRMRVRVSATGGPLAGGCTIGTNAEPIDVNALITGTTAPPGPNTPITGTPYNPATGRARIVNNSFSVPGAQNCGTFALFVNLNDQINSQLGLPSPAGNNEAQFTVEFMGTRPQPAIIASFTATPATGPAPLTVSFNASASTATGPTYQWDFTNNGSFDASGVTASHTYPSPGTFTARLRVSDSDGDFAETTRLVSVGTNAPPTALDAVVTTPEDTPVPVTLTGSDPEGLPLAFALTGPAAASGTVTGTPPDVVYTPGPDFNGSDQFGFRVTDNFGNSDTGVISVQVTSVNDPPVAIDVAAATTEDSATGVELVATDVDGDPLTYEVVADPARGSVACSPSGSCTYTPDPDENGVDTFDFVAVDPSGAVSAPATATVTIGAVNDAPVADDIEIAATEDTATPITLTASDVEVGTLTFSILTLPAHGILAGSPPNLVYTPAANYSGPDTFTYRVADSTGASDTGVVTIAVAPVNDPPAASDAFVATQQDTPVTVDIVAVDPDGDALDYAPTSPTPAGGTVACAGAACTYTPAAGFSGSDSFEVAVSDGKGGSDTARVDVNVEADDNAPPVTSDTTVVVIEDTARHFSLPATDADGDVLTFTVLAQPSEGTLTCSATGACTYVPAPNGTTAQSFPYRVADGRGGIDSATVTLLLVPTNDIPVPAATSLTTAEDTVGLVDLVATDPDPGTTLTWVVKRAPMHGALACTSAGACTYTPAADFNGADFFEVEVDDGHGGRVRLTVPVTVTPVDDPPRAGTVHVSVLEDGSTTFALTGTDDDGDVLTFTAGTSSSGALSCSANGACTFSAAPDATGVDTVAYTAGDGTSTVTGAIVIVIVPVNDAPVAQDLELATDEDTPVAVTLLATDVDGDALTYQLTSAPGLGFLSGAAPDLVYTPAPQASGTTSFGFVARDPGGEEAAGSVTIVVLPVDDEPVADTVSVATPEDTPVAVALGGSDEEGPVTVEVTSPPSHGTFTGGIYIPDAGYHGPDEIGFSVTDSGGQQAAGVATIVVIPVNDPPQAFDAVVFTTRTVPVAITLAGTDVDGDTLTYAVLTGPDHGTLSGTAPNLTYTPAGVYEGPDALTFSVTDPSGAVDSGTVRITVDRGAALPTQLTADPARVTKPTGLLAFLQPYRYTNLTAVLTTASGIPIPGEGVHFSVAGTPICSATTDSTGRATCSGTGPRVNSQAYVAQYGGTPAYGPSATHGALFT